MDPRALLKHRDDLRCLGVFLDVYSSILILHFLEFFPANVCKCKGMYVIMYV